MHSLHETHETHEKGKVTDDNLEQPYKQGHTQKLRQLHSKIYHKHSETRQTQLQFMKVGSRAG